MGALKKRKSKIMKTVYVTRRERFNAAYKLWNDAWDAEKNIATYGKCANPNWHGHNYEVHVTIKGVPASDTGYCMDLKDLRDIIKEHVTERLDHKNLNLDVPFMAGKMTSTEVLIIAIWEELEEKVSENGCELHHLRLYETENNYADYYGGE